MQKAAYELRISDWSSDVCSSDLAGAAVALALTGICFAIGVTDGAVIIALLCMFVAFFAFSLGPIKWIVISEIFPTGVRARAMGIARSEEHTSELQSLMRISYAVFCLKKKKNKTHIQHSVDDVTTEDN